MATPPPTKHPPNARAGWTTAGEGLRMARQPTLLKRSAVIAVIVGTLLSVINQVHLILGGDATGATWVRVGANYVVPFVVSMAGALWAMRDPSTAPTE